eukprot:evm.model.scf_164.6 EVM.evm.TU.scf_164.6   scf_164:81516-84759(-)
MHTQDNAASGAETVGFLHARKAGDRLHFCVSCGFPIATYGRLSPCLHAFCLTCATDMERCYICNAQINRIERIGGGARLYVSSVTLQSFKSTDDLKQHTQRVYSHLMACKEVSAPEAVSSSYPPQPSPSPQGLAHTYPTRHQMPYR